MMRGVANLPQSDQLLLNDIYFKEMTLKQIGEKHGISKQALHKKHSRILKTLSKVDDK
jgi:DNA-directed RNA polymerase specialized sigma subunit